MLSNSKATLHKAPPKKSAKRDAGEEAAHSNRVVALYVKVTDFGKDDEGKPLFINDVDHVTEIECVEIINGKLTKEHFHTYVKPTDPAFLKRCVDTYHQRLDADQAQKLSDALTNAPAFSESQKAFFEFLRKDNAKVVVHTINRVLHYLRRSCDKNGLAILTNHPWMCDITSDARLLHRNGMYHAMQAPTEIDKDSTAVYKSSKEQKPSFTFDSICNELGKIKTQRREWWEAQYDARHLAITYINSRDDVAKAASLEKEKHEHQSSTKKRR